MFFRRGGLLYRRWTPAGRGVEREIEQLILPEKCRRTVLKLAHEIPIAGHLGSEKTRQRLLRRFYWPGVFKDVEEFYRSCPTCQKTSQHRVSRAPLIPLLIISEPFSRIAMDIVRPLPRRSWEIAMFWSYEIMPHDTWKRFLFIASMPNTSRRS